VEVISTTVSSRERSISVLLENGLTERYAHLRRPNGGVSWTLDQFTREMAGGPLVWAAHGGTLTVAEVLERIPGARRDVLRWTQEELDDGPDILEVDIFSRENRRRALERLAYELAVADRAAS
jgi:hypothetical protein